MKIKFLNTVSLLLVMFCLLQCNESKKLPEVYFDSPFPKRTKNLFWKLGNEFAIRSGNDTVVFDVIFDRKKRENHIVNKQNGDTIFSGTVCKYKGLYYFNHAINDSVYWISAVRIDRNFFDSVNTICGLNSGFEQMMMLADELQNGNFSGLISYTNTDTSVMRLRPDKEILAKVYQKIIESLPSDTLVSRHFWDTQANRETANPATGNIEERSGKIVEYDFEEFSLIKNLYPNPTEGEVNITLNRNGKFRIKIFSARGELIEQSTLNGFEQRFSLEKYPAGIYYLKIKDRETELPAETIRIMKIE